MRRTSTNLGINPSTNLGAQRGFTLVELLLVLLIIAVVAAIAAPTLSGFTRGRVLPNTAGNLVTTARWCRNAAISDSIAYRLNIDIGQRKWWVTKDDGTGNFVQVPEEYGKEVILPDGIDFQGVVFQSQAPDTDGSYITFDPGGKTEAAIITLGSDGRTMEVACDTPLGTFHIVQGAVQ
ncbi:MAG TPA: prepilin-type N-terminal cleavage/methylation domain-containing protein [Phycisphaerae bacterium]|jgi:type II secretion system protein H